ncbi:MAG TPA: hypothetical protein VKY74_22425, partial [Chloroflexia bacterium]|nr:hypothetical protein [Chloroflexia bacterium]
MHQPSTRCALAGVLLAGVSIAAGSLYLIPGPSPVRAASGLGVIPMQGTPSATATPICSPSGAIVTSPNAGTSRDGLNAVAGVAANDVWAVEYELLDNGNWRSPPLHWDGSSWSIIPNPTPGIHTDFYDVAARTTNDVWAVGGYKPDSSHYQTQTQHWDGTSWTFVASPNVGQGLNNLVAVAPIAANDVWAAGFANNGVAQTLTEHWTGSSWQIVPSANVGTGANQIFGLAAVAANDIWAVGNYNTGTRNQTLVEHGTGSSWQIVASPNMGTGSNFLQRVAALAGNNVWAVGYYVNASMTRQTLVEHWDGTTWSIVPSANTGTGQNTLDGIAVLAADDIWAGGFAGSSPTQQNLVEHWDGSQWSIIPSPDAGSGDNGLHGLAAVPGGGVWAVGSATNAGVERTLTIHYAITCPAAT